MLIIVIIGEGSQYFQENGSSALKFRDGFSVFFHYKRLFQGRAGRSLKNTYQHVASLEVFWHTSC